MATYPLPHRAHLTLTPRLFVGIDVGKSSHVAGFVSASLLKQKRFEQCPTLSFEQSQAGITKLLSRIQEYVPLEQCAVLVESTGHYHRVLCEQLLARGISVYVISVYSRRINGLSKTDRADALRLANSLYAQLALDLQLVEKSQQVRRLLPATDAALQLQGFIQRRYEVVQSSTRTKNKLTAICDELFPEFSSIFKDPNSPTAAGIRLRWPTPALLADVSLEELRVAKRGKITSDQKLEKLRDAARASIGVTNPARVEALVFEQTQLLEGLQLLWGQLETLEEKIAAILQTSREGQILLSMDCMGTIHAATLLAAIGNIRNFPSKAALRKYCGWAPQLTQTGISLDRAAQNKTGSRLVKQALFLLASRVIADEGTVWQALFERLVPLKCSYDAKSGTYKGKLRVVGRVAGQMIGVIYALLKADADLVDSYPAGEPLPAPQLYDRQIHAGTTAKVALTPLPDSF